MPTIVMYGPTYSGKSSLFRAFLRVLTNPNMSIAPRQHLDLSLYKNDTLLTNADVSPSEVRTTQWEKIDKLTFRRQLRDATPDQQALQINQHEHEIDAFDNAGRLFGVAADENITSLKHLKAQSREIETAWETLEMADGIVVLLDPSEILGNRLGEQQYSSGEDNGTNSDQEMPFTNPGELENGPGDRHARRIYTPVDYARLVGRLSWLSPTTSLGTPRRLAIGINKIDLLGDAARLSHDKLVIRYFTEEMHITLLNLHKHFSPNNQQNVRTFAISALGYRPDGTPNWNGTWLADSSRWEPVNVEQPFLWMFEQIERDRIFAMGKKNRLQNLLGLSQVFIDKYRPYYPKS